MPTSARLGLKNLGGTMWASSPTICDKENDLYMKAAVIVRRIEEYGIIGQKSLKAA